MTSGLALRKADGAKNGMRGIWTCQHAGADLAIKQS